MLYFEVRSWLYLGTEDGRPSFQLSKEFLVNMERHVSCDCNNCVEKRKCEENQVEDGCECKCINEQDAVLCTGENQYWSKEKCMCECKNNCPPEQRSSIDHDCRCTPAIVPYWSFSDVWYKRRLGTFFRKNRKNH
ncbi:hypothetical protein D918_02968 [Trichuris suis]|nr:hypothetical protein D918_02968 [Trichuris suis]